MTVAQLAGSLKTKMNGTFWQRVAQGLLVLTVVALVTHYLRRDLHQTEREKQNQTYVWFDQWWDHRFKRDVKPEFDELKQMIRDLEKGD